MSKKQTVATPKATPKLPTTIDITEWKVGQIKWSEKWIDAKTEKRGSAFYSIQLGQTDKGVAEFTTDDNATQAIQVTRNFFAKPEEREKLPVIQFSGGKPVYEKLKKQMPIVYININPEYQGHFYMTPERYQRYIDENKVVLSSADMKQVANQLPS